MTAPEPAAAPRALLIGRSPAVMDHVLAELSAMGVAADGSTDPESAADRPDAAGFAVVALGRGISGDLRERLRAAFRAANPAVRLLDVTLAEAPRLVAAALAGYDPKAVDLDAYFDRIGYRGSRAPTLETLQNLVTAHLAAITFENVDVLLGRGIDIAPRAVDAKLVAGRRGGYCYEQNGLFKRVLAALGFEVDGFMGRVRLNHRPGDPPMARSHMTLKVLVEGAPHLVDVGFGGTTPPAPLRLDETRPQRTAHGRYRILSFGPSRLLQAEIDGVWGDLYEVGAEAQLDVDYAPANWFTSTHPSSFFTRELVAARTTPEARHTLYGARLTTRTPDGGVERRVLGADELERALSETFRLPVAPDWRPLIERAAAAGAA